MPKGKCVFNQKWLENCEYSGWLKEDANKHIAKCSVCSKTFDISNMGEAAVRSHKDGAKHKKYASIRLSNTLRSSMDDRGGSRIFRTSVKKKSDRTWSAQGVVSAGRGQRRAWWTPRGLNNFNADSPYIKFDSTFEEMIVSPNIRAHQHA